MEELKKKVEDLADQNAKLKEKCIKESNKRDLENKEINRQIEEQKKEIQELNEKSEKLEVKVEELEKTLKEVSERLASALATANETEGEGDDESQPASGDIHRAAGSVWSTTCTRSRRTAKSSIRRADSRESTWASGISDGFTDKEVTQMKKLLYNKDRIERACNIVVKGAQKEIEEIEKNENENLRNDFKGWVEKFLSIKLGIKLKIIHARVVGGRDRVIIAKLENEDDKRKIMTNKSKLKGSKIYIESDLSFEDRRKQEEIKKWCYDRRVKGWKVKIGVGRVCVNNQWIKWEDKESIRKIEYEEAKNDVVRLRREVPEIAVNRVENNQKKGDERGERGGESSRTEVIVEINDRNKGIDREFRIEELDKETRIAINKRARKNLIGNGTKKNAIGEETRNKEINNQKLGLGKKRVLFWNVRGLLGKDMDFWNYVVKNDVVSLSETWIEKKRFDYVKTILPHEFEWEIIEARRKCKEGRASGGFVIGVRKDLIGSGHTRTIEIEEGLVKTEIISAEESFTFWSVYNSKNTEKIMEKLEEIEVNEEGKIIIGGDFNIRIGEKGRHIVLSGKEDYIYRKSKDKKCSNNWEKIVDLCEGKGWKILNGNTQGDRDGEFTYIGDNGVSVIDYVMVNDELWDEDLEFRIEDSIDSDHAPLVLEIKSEEHEKIYQNYTEEKKEIWKKMTIWNEESIKQFKEKTKDLCNKLVEKKEDSVEDRWKDTKEIIGKAWTIERKKIRKRKLGYKIWWDKNCSILKRRAKEKYKRWKKGKMQKSHYLAAKKDWRKTCKEKERKWKEEQLVELKNLKNENQDKITGEKRKTETERKDEEKIIEAEIRAAWKSLKKKKTPGWDDIPNEAWIYGSEEINNKLIAIIGKIWDGEEIPDSWKTGVIVPIFKKGDTNDTNNYRGITLLPTAYKIYAQIIRTKLVKEVEEKKLLPEGQAGFRKGRSTLDNIFILDHVIKRAKRKKEKLYALFIDLKAAFDTVNRRKLWTILERIGVSKYLTERMKGIYEETRVRVRTTDGTTEDFWTELGLRQGCVLCPILFCLYISELEKMFKVRNVGGIKIGNSRIWTLDYADDIVLLALNREAMLDMISTLRLFLDERDLTLRFTFNAQGNYKNHIKELKKKGITAVKEVWGLGERAIKGDIGRREMLFNYLVRSVIEYGVELWGWEERKELENILLTYWRWVLGLDFCTARYLIYREIDIEKMKGRWGIRALEFEKK
ncbi:uncharacterized protein LOC131675385 [Phymastichus coffea]|uniref:uncharacterized protein LOC131675385 n=1 Tax=Phymastichus coffea TaxID=108790 RepID=UPI00273B3B20|nr:uncharacterized protein LOC131675385 [Phymastichus coffea]